MIFGEGKIWKRQSADGQVADNGDYIPGEDSWLEPEVCDVLPNGKAKEVTLPDGTRHVYNYEITLNPEASNIRVGDTIRLQTSRHSLDDMSLSGQILKDARGRDILVQALREYTVLGFQRYSICAKIWV